MEGNKYFITNNLSKTLDKIGVTEIGRRSLYDVGCLTLQIGVTSACFHELGGIDDAKDLLKRWVTTSVSSKRQFLKSQYGSGSAPCAVFFTDCNARDISNLLK